MSWQCRKRDSGQTGNQLHSIINRVNLGIRLIPFIFLCLAVFLAYRDAIADVQDAIVLC